MHEHNTVVEDPANQANMLLQENQDGLEWIIYYLGDNVGWALNRGHVLLGNVVISKKNPTLMQDHGDA